MNFYTTYALIENGVVIEYPVNPRVLLASTGDFNVPWNWGGGELDGKTYAYCHNKEPYITHEQVVVETTPYFDSEADLWYRGYEIQAASVELIAKRYAEALDCAQKAIDEICAMYSDIRAQELGLSSNQRADWAEFRQETQLVPKQNGYPFSYRWPALPDSEQSKMTLGVVRI